MITAVKVVMNPFCFSRMAPIKKNTYAILHPLCPSVLHVLMVPFLGCCALLSSTLPLLCHFPLPFQIQEVGTRMAVATGTCTEMVAPKAPASFGLRNRPYPDAVSLVGSFIMISQSFLEESWAEKPIFRLQTSLTWNTDMSNYN